MLELDMRCENRGAFASEVIAASIKAPGDFSRGLQSHFEDASTSRPAAAGSQRTFGGLVREFFRLSGKTSAQTV